VEYVAERVASCCVKHICNKLLMSVKQQGAADVAQLVSASAIMDVVNSGSETDTKQLKVCIMNSCGTLYFYIQLQIRLACVSNIKHT
jgi:hypothetical protein